MLKNLTLLLSIGCVTQGALWAERAVPANQRYERLVCIAPMTGAGSFVDPKRPLFAPTRPDPSGISAFSFQTSDDGNSAIVEYVAFRPDVFKLLESDSRMKCFSRYKHKKNDVEKELKKFRKDFDFGKFGMNVR